MDDNIKKLQDALEWLDRGIREEVELDGEMSNEHAIQLGFIQNMLAKFPRRNCDVGTDNEQIRRWKEFCDRHEVDRSPESFARWAQGPYFEEGGAK